MLLLVCCLGKGGDILLLPRFRSLAFNTRSKKETISKTKIFVNTILISDTGGGKYVRFIIRAMFR